jgi:hypothetical protein
MSGEHRADQQPAQSPSSRYPGRAAGRPAVLVERRAVGARPAPAQRLGTGLAVGPPNERSASGRGASPDSRTGDHRSARASQPANPDQASHQQRQEGRAMTAAQPGSLDRQGVRSLEVRWIFPGPLPGAVAEWFRRFPAETRVVEDVYLLDPHLPGLSVKVREGAGGKGVPRQPRVSGGGRACPRSPRVLAEVVVSTWPARPQERRSCWLAAGKQEAPDQPVSTDQRGGRSGGLRGTRVCGGTHRGPRSWGGLVDPGF